MGTISNGVDGRQLVRLPMSAVDYKFSYTGQGGLVIGGEVVSITY